jgi:hypothetical protein
MILPALILPPAVPPQAGTVRGILPHAHPPRPKPFAWFACFAVPTCPFGQCHFAKRTQLMRGFVWHETTSGKWRSGALAERRILLGLGQRHKGADAMEMGTEWNRSLPLCVLASWREAIFSCASVSIQPILAACANCRTALATASVGPARPARTCPGAPPARRHTKDRPAFARL